MHLQWCSVFCCGLAFATLEVANAAARAPSIEASAQNLVLSVPGDADVQIMRYGPDGDALGAPGAVLTEGQVQKLIQDGLVDNKALFEAEIAKATLDVTARVVAQVAASTNARFTRLENEIAALEGLLAAVEKTSGQQQLLIGEASGTQDGVLTCLTGMLKAGT